MQKLKKLLVVSTMFVTVLSMCAFAAPKAEAASAGDLIKMNGLSSIYYLGSDGKRYVFPNQATYFSWYKDFSSVKVISQAELEALPLGANVTMRPGTNLVKITTNPKVYAVTAGGTLVAIPDEATAKTLYGDNWAKKVVDVPDAFFTNYKTSSAVASATAYPEGSLVKFGSGADVYYINANGQAQKIASETAFEANRLNWNYVNNSTLSLPTTGDSITGVNSTLVDTSSGAGGVPAVGGSGLTVSLSGDTLSSTNVPSSASLVPFATYNLTASNDGAVNVTDVTLTRFGTGQSSDFDGAYLYQGDKRLTNKKSIDSSNNTIQFSSIGLLVPAGKTVSVTLKANILSSKSGSHAFKIAAAKDIVAGAASVSGSFPVSGNMMSLSSSVSAATLELKNAGSLTVNKKVGETQVVVGEYTINNSTNNEDVNIYRVRLKQNGTAGANSATNYSLDLDGTVVASGVQMDSEKYVDFVLATPFKLQKSKIITAAVRADIVTDITKTIELYLNNVVDFEARGSAYGTFYSAGIINTSVNAGTVSVITIKGSSIDVSLDGPTAQDVKKNITGVTFANLKIKANNEDVNIENLKMTIDMQSATSSLKNVKLVDSANNASYTVSDPSVLSSTAVTFENVYLKKGVQYTFAVKGDIPDTAPAGHTYKVSFSFNCPTDTKGRYVNSDTAIATSDFSASTLTGQTMTVNFPSVAFDKITTNDSTVVKSAIGVLLYKGKVTASSVDNLKVTKMTFAATTTTTSLGTGFDRLYLYLVNSDGTETKLDDETSLSTSVGAVSVSFSGFTVELPKGISGTKYFVVRGDVKSAPIAGTVVFGLKGGQAETDFTVRDTDNNTLTNSYITITSTAGSTTTIAGKGAMTMDFDTNEAGINSNKNVLAGSTYLAGRIKMTAQKENAKIIDLALKMTGTSTDSDVSAIYLYKDKDMTSANLVGQTSMSVGGDAKFEALNYEVPTVGTAYLYVAVATKPVDYSVSKASGSTGTSGQAIKFKVATSTGTYNTKVRGVSTGEDYVNGTEATIGTTETKVATMLGAVISSLTTSFANGSLGIGQNKIFSFKVTAPAPSNNVAYDGTALGIKLATTDFAVSKSADITPTEYKVQRVGGALVKQAVTPTVNATTGSTTINWENAFGASQDLIVKPGETAEYEIFATIADGGGVENSSLQVSINDLNAFLYKHSTTDVNTNTGNYYPVISGVSDVIGGRLTQ